MRKNPKSKKYWTNIYCQKRLRFSFSVGRQAVLQYRSMPAHFISRQPGVTEVKYNLYSSSFSFVSSYS